MRTGTTVVGVFAVAAVAFFVVSQFGGLDRPEFIELMNGPKPEQARLTPEPDEGTGDDLPGKPAPVARPPEAPPPASEAPEVVAPPQSDLVTSTVRGVRNVTAPGMTPAPPATGRLEREAEAKRPSAPLRWRVFSPVRVVEAGQLDVGPRTLRLAGIVSPAEDRRCRRPATDAVVEMSCARLAMLALRSRIRAFGVECQVSADDGKDLAVAPCRIGKTDLSFWLIEQGWAEAGPKAPEGYAVAEKAARCARRGMWQADAPPADCLQN
ncbi:thermonuclease family protein [Kaistia adipata]|uniref:thermonuclease family protein n=1 Tax=Kaistia adipata TaxID=166954 RepID=UPI00048A920C|nr:thermonuclease family protein [Kaistia adipata]